MSFLITWYTTDLPKDVIEILEKDIQSRPKPPEPEPLTAQQKLEAAGLTIEELKDLLGL